jgi:hypothetical protein
MKGRWLSFCFFAILATPLLVDPLALAFDRSTRAKWGRTAKPYLSWQTLRDGKFGPAFEEAWKEASFVARVTGARYNEVVYRSLRHVPHELVVGREASLFLRNQTTELGVRKAAARMDRAAARIGEFARILEQTDIALYVLIVPARSRTYPDLAYEDGAAPPRLAGFLPGVEAKLRSAGIRVISLDEPLRRGRATAPVFYRDDHHWTFHGSHIAALASAAVLGKGAADGTMDLCWQPDSTHRGSLAHKLKFVEGGALEGRFRDPQPRPHCLPAFQSTQPARVWVLTTSYGLWGFPEFLSLALDEPVSGLIGAGKGFYFSANQFISQVANNPEIGMPEVIVWEIPEYHLYREDLLEGFSVPALRRTKGTPVPFTVESSLDARRRRDGSVRLGGTTGEFTVTLGRPARRLRLMVESSAMPSRGFLDVRAGAKEIRYMLIDGRGPIGYDFELPENTATLAVRFEATRPGATLRIHEARALDKALP